MAIIRVRQIRTDIQTVANRRVGISISDREAIFFRHELVRRQLGQHRLALGRIGRQRPEPSDGKAGFLIRYDLRAA